MEINVTEEKMLSLIEEYIQTCKEKSAIRNLLLEKKQESQAPFYDCWCAEKGDVPTAIRETIKSYSSSKTMAIRRSKAFIKWLEKKLNTKYNIDWPPIDVGRDFERMIYMMRALQERPDLEDNETLVEYLENKLWISDRTINDGLSRMNHADHSKEATLLNTTLAINGMTRNDGTVSFLSTAHPILLIENLTCVAMMLYVMLKNAEDPKQHDALLLTAGHIWSQLTEYARKRVIEAITKWYGDDSIALARLRELPVAVGNIQFVPETQAFPSIKGKLMYCLKSDTRCLLEYENEEGIKTCIGVPRVDSGDFDGICIQTDDGHRIPIRYGSIKSCKIEARLH